MIITCKKEIPFRWIFFAVLPWASFGYLWSVCGAAFIFSLRKFVENPAGLTFILSLPTLLAIIVGPCTNFLSDRIWTRVGRRKPFIIASWIGIISSLVLMPLMPNFWLLLGAYLLYSFSSDLNAPLEPLKQEIIPPHERGRATGTMQWCQNLAAASFYFVALGRFDDVRYMAGVPITGEAIIYWSGGLLLSVMLLLIILGIKELDQKSPLVGQRLSLHNIVGGLFDRELWPVYLLVFGSSTLSTGLGPLSNLLYTDQWDYTKQDMGINFAVGGTINMFIIGLLTIFADKLNRMKAYQTLICLSVMLNFSYFCYVTFVLPNQRPSLVEIIVFGETGSIIGLLTGMVYIPLVYDYIRRNKMGTYGAGAGIVNRLTSLITLNGIGLFVWGYAMFFQPPAGEMTRIVLRSNGGSHKTELRRQLDSATWTDPESGVTIAPSQVATNPWQADGTRSDSANAWEIRLNNPSSAELAAERDQLLKEKSLLIVQEKMARDEAEIQTRQGRPPVASQLLGKAGTIHSRISTLHAHIQEINSHLDNRASNFQRQVTAALGNRLISDGDQILNGKIESALEITLPVRTRPDVRDVEKSLTALRLELPELIDLRPVKTENGYSVVASLLIPPESDDETHASTIAQTLRKALRHKGTSLITDVPSSVPFYSRKPALTLDLMTVESPLDTYVSPIHRVVNLVLGLFDAVPKPDRKLSATARNLRMPTEINHVRVHSGAIPRTITVTAVLPPTAPTLAVSDPVSERLQFLLRTPSEKMLIPQVRAFYDRVEKCAATQHLTIARPILAVSYAPMKYNYMSGYILMFLMGMIGISITILFSRLEANGYIRKRGVEEALAS